MDDGQRDNQGAAVPTSDSIIQPQKSQITSREANVRMDQTSNDSNNLGIAAAESSRAIDSRTSQDQTESSSSYMPRSPATWAAEFQPPASAGEIKAPSRRNPRQKRRALEGYEIRSKRFRGKYNYAYRDLLNANIQRAASKEFQEDLDPLEDSQIGASNWNSMEKSMFFEALATLGRDNVRGIASRIGSKSEVEVQQYLMVLQESSKSQLTALEIPAAFEISEECCALLEETSHVIAAREECAEVQPEQQKWGKFWLVTSKACQGLEQGKNSQSERKFLERASPFFKLFLTKNWLQLSERVFMNSAEVPDENWENLAELGETPGIRATAFEDFYSLTVSIIKKLISTAFFCTMSRLKATDTHKPKNLEINVDDIAFAVNILGMKNRKEEYWTKCARRCRLEVIDDTKLEGSEEQINDLSEIDLSGLQMTYDEVEKMLGSGAQTGMITSHDQPTQPDNDSNVLNYSEAAPPKEIIELNEQSLESDIASSIEDESDVQNQSLSRDEQRNIAKLDKYMAAEEAQDLHTDAADIRASREDESALWEMLKKEPPLIIDDEKAHLEDLPLVIPNSTDGDDWRDYLEYCSEWETFDKQVSEERFHFNRMKKSKKAQLKELLNLNHRGIRKDDSAQNFNSFEIIDAANTRNDREESFAQYVDNDTESRGFLSDSSAQTDDTMAQFRGLAATFQPSSDESEQQV